MNYIQKMLSVMVCLLVAAPCSLYSEYTEPTAQIIARAENAAAILAKDPNNYQAAQDLFRIQTNDKLPQQKINRIINEQAKKSTEELRKIIIYHNEENIKKNMPELSPEDVKILAEIREATDTAIELQAYYQGKPITGLAANDAANMKNALSKLIPLLTEANNQARALADDTQRKDSIQKISTLKGELAKTLEALENHIKSLGSKTAPAEEKPDVVKPVEPKPDTPIKPDEPVAVDKPAGTIPEAPIRPLSDSEVLSIIKKSHEEFKALEAEVDALLKESEKLIPKVGFLGFGKNDPQVDQLKACIEKIKNFDVKITAAKAKNIDINKAVQLMKRSDELLKADKSRDTSVNSVYKKHAGLQELEKTLQAALEKKAPEEPSTELKAKIAGAIQELNAQNNISDIVALVTEKDALIKDLQEIKNDTDFNATEKKKISFLEKINNVQKLKKLTPFFSQDKTPAQGSKEYSSFEESKIKTIGHINDFLLEKTSYADAETKIGAIATDYNAKNPINNNAAIKEFKEKVTNGFNKIEFKNNIIDTKVNQLLADLDKNPQKFDQIKKSVDELIEKQIKITEAMEKASKLNKPLFIYQNMGDDKRLKLQHSDAIGKIDVLFDSYANSASTDLTETENNFNSLIKEIEQKNNTLFEIEKERKNIIALFKEKEALLAKIDAATKAGFLAGERAPNQQEETEIKAKEEALKKAEKTLSDSIDRAENSRVLVQGTALYNYFKDITELNDIKTKIAQHEESLKKKRTAAAKNPVATKPEPAKPADAPKPADVTKPATVAKDYTQLKTYQEFANEMKLFLNELKNLTGKKKTEKINSLNGSALLFYDALNSYKGNDVDEITKNNSLNSFSKIFKLNKKALN